jgi:uncharacterized membrane protein
MLLTKTVSSRNRTPRPQDIKYHWAHLTSVALGIVIALAGAWVSSSWPVNAILAGLVVLLIVLAGSTLLYDLVTTYKSEIDDKPTTKQTAKQDPQPHADK